MQKRYSREERAAHWQAWKDSGLTQSVYCDQNGLKSSSFKNWGNNRPKAKLIPVKLSSPLVGTSVTVNWYGSEITLPSSLPMKDWQTLLLAIKALSV